jgi:hypothetical protein
MQGDPGQSTIGNGMKTEVSSSGKESSTISKFLHLLYGRKREA